MSIHRVASEEEIQEVLRRTKMGSILTKTRTIMHRKNALVFTCEDGEEEYANHRLAFDGDVWDDMGQPDTITVTIEPGDTLNVDEA